MTKKKSRPSATKIRRNAAGGKLAGMNVPPGQLCLWPNTVCGQQCKITLTADGPESNPLSGMLSYRVSEIQEALKPKDFENGPINLRLCTMCPGTICPVAEAEQMAIPRAQTGLACTLCGSCHYPKANCIFRRSDSLCGRNSGRPCEPEVESFKLHYGQGKHPMRPPRPVDTPTPHPPGGTAADPGFKITEVPRIWSKTRKRGAGSQHVHLPHPRANRHPPVRWNRHGRPVAGASGNQDRHRRNRQPGRSWNR